MLREPQKMGTEVDTEQGSWEIGSGRLREGMW